MSQTVATQAPAFLGQTTTVDFASITREPVIVRPREERLDPGSTITLVLNAKNPAAVISNLALECDVIFVLPYVGPMLRIGGFYNTVYSNFVPTNPITTAVNWGYTNNFAYNLANLLVWNSGGTGPLKPSVIYGGTTFDNPFLDQSYPYYAVQHASAQFGGKYTPTITSTPLPAFGNNGFSNACWVVGLQGDRPFPTIEPHKGEGWIASLFSRVVIQASNGQIFQELNGTFGFSHYHKLKMYLQNDPRILEQYDYYAGTGIFNHCISPFPDLFAQLPHGHKLANSITLSGLLAPFQTSTATSTMTVTKHVICTLPFPLDHFPAYFISAGDDLQLIVSLAPSLSTNFTSNPQLFSGSMSMMEDSVFGINSRTYNAGMVTVESNKPIQDVIYSPTLSFFDYALYTDTDTSTNFLPGQTTIQDGIYSGLSVLIKAFYLDTSDLSALLGSPDLSLFNGVPSGIDNTGVVLWDPAFPLSQIMSRGFTAFMKISYLDNPEFTASTALGPPSVDIIKDVSTAVGRPRAEHRDIAVKIFANQIHSIFVEPSTSLSTQFSVAANQLFTASEHTQHESLAHKAGRVRIELVSPVMVHLPIQDAMYGATLQSTFTATPAQFAGTNNTVAATPLLFNTPQPSYSFNSFNNSYALNGETIIDQQMSSNLTFANLNFTLQYTIAVGAKCMPQWPHFGYTPLVPLETLMDVREGAFTAGDLGLNQNAIGPEFHNSFTNAASNFLPPTPDVLPTTSYSLRNLVLRYDYSLMPESLTQAFLSLYTRTGIKLSYVQPFILETTLQSLVNRTTQFLLPVTTPCGFSVSVLQTDNQDRGGPVYLPISPFSSMIITLGGQQVLNNIPTSHLLLAAGSPYPLFTPNCSSNTWTPNPHIITRNSGVDFFLLAPLQMTWSNIAGKADYPVNLGVAIAFQDHFSTYWAFNSSGGCSIHKIQTPILLNFSISPFFHPSVVYPIFNLKGAFLQNTTTEIYPVWENANIVLGQQTALLSAPSYNYNTSSGPGYPYYVYGFEGILANSTVAMAAGPLYSQLFGPTVPSDYYAITSFHSWPEVPYPSIFNSTTTVDGSGVKLRVTVYQAISVTCRAANLFGGSASLPTLVFTS